VTAVVVVRFRKYWPYNGGVATDLLDHKLAPATHHPRRAGWSRPHEDQRRGRAVRGEGRPRHPGPFLLTVDYPQFSVLLVSTLTNDTQRPDPVDGNHGTMDLAGEPLLKFNGDFQEEFQAKNGGRIEAKSDGPGRSSEFVVRLPVDVEASRPPAADTQEEPAAPKSSLRILIVDDNKDGADSLAMMLKMMGNDIRTAYDGKEGVELAGEFR